MREAKHPRHSKVPTFAVERDKHAAGTVARDFVLNGHRSAAGAAGQPDIVYQASTGAPARSDDSPESKRLLLPFERFSMFKIPRKARSSARFNWVTFEAVQRVQGLAQLTP